MVGAALAAILMAQEAKAQATCMGGMAMGGTGEMQEIPAPEKLPAAVKMVGLGNAHIRITGSAEAQGWFDQGLNLMHDFWDYESAKAFEQGVRVDPKCAMCWWGLARIEGFRGGTTKVYATGALAEAVKLKGHVSKGERLYIEAAEAEAAAKEGDSSKATAIYRRLVASEPKDLEARIFLAESLDGGFDDKGEPKTGQKERIAILEGVLRDAPEDSAANHYWIHAVEPGNHPELALKSAALLARLAPGSGHMVHMPGHIYYRVGDYVNAEKWFEASTETDEKYMREMHVGPDDDWNYVHNMMYSIANLMEQGRLQEANSLSDRLVGARGKMSPTLYVWSARDSMARLNNRLPVALRLGDWDGVLAMLEHAPVAETEKTANLRLLAGELREFATGMRALDRGDVAEARAASVRMDAGLWRGEQEVQGKAAAKKKEAEEKMPPMMPLMPDAEGDPLLKSLGVASMELRAGVLVAEGKPDAGKKLYAAAQVAEKKLGYHEPPIYVRPVGETEAAALLRAKDFAGAKSAYDEALKERPGSGFGLYGLARVKEMAGDEAGARLGYTEFLKAWPAADAGLPEVGHAREMVARGAMAGR